MREVQIGRNGKVVCGRELREKMWEVGGGKEL